MEASVRIGAVLETAIYVDDVERSSRFYQEVLGLREFLSAEGRFAALQAGDGPSIFLLFRKDATSEPVITSGGTIPPHGGAGRLHMAFSIPMAEWQDWVDRFNERGVAIASVVEWSRGGKSLYFYDPDGHLIELATPGIWEVY
jgi:catechol 2,3-dioxygenase-like lactoylglutathione lyase family enzyme